MAYEQGSGMGVWLNPATSKVPVGFTQASTGAPAVGPSFKTMPDPTQALMGIADTMYQRGKNNAIAKPIGIDKLTGATIYEAHPDSKIYGLSPLPEGNNVYKHDLPIFHERFKYNEKVKEAARLEEEKRIAEEKKKEEEKSVFNNTDTLTLTPAQDKTEELLVKKEQAKKDIEALNKIISKQTFPPTPDQIAKMEELSKIIEGGDVGLLNLLEQLTEVGPEREDMEYGYFKNRTNDGYSWGWRRKNQDNAMWDYNFSDYLDETKRQFGDAGKVIKAWWQN